MKKIKSSKRGLTFSLPDTNQVLTVGEKFHYIINMISKEIVIVPSKDGSNTVSKKKVGRNIKPLVDIRSKEVKDLVQKRRQQQCANGVPQSIARLVKNTVKKALCANRNTNNASKKIVVEN